MSAAASATTDAPPKPKSKKRLFILIGIVVLALVGAAAALLMLQKNTAAEQAAGHAAEAVEPRSSRSDTPPTFLALENMVVNLADPGGNRFVQIGITLQLQDEATSDAIKIYMPKIRSGVLLLISQRTSDQILHITGKEELSAAIIQEISGTMGYAIKAPQTQGGARPAQRQRAQPNPIEAVLFSSFIVQ